MSMRSKELPLAGNVELPLQANLHESEYNALALSSAMTHERNIYSTPIEKSKLNLLADAIKSERLLVTSDGGRMKSKRNASIITQALGVFLLKRDWTQVFGESLTAEEIGQDYNIPYPHSVFEMGINGVHAIVVALQEEGEPPGLICFGEYGGHWVLVDLNQIDPDIGNPNKATTAFNLFALDQVRALCVALDTEIAKVGPAVMPSKLKSQMQKDKGKTPTFKYSVVDLHERRLTRTAAGESTGRKVRLHFRRGHWRHYIDHKTWIKWCLAGSPEVGVVEHHYEA